MSDEQRLFLVRVWDLPTRLFHWALAFCVAGLLITGNVGGGAMVFHFRFGYVIMTLLLFRLVWGLVGGRWSRFSSFISGPRSFLAYLRDHSSTTRVVGHSPLGALSVLAILTVLIVQVGSGLMSDDEISFAGPLTAFVTNATVGLATTYHKAVGKWLVLGLVLLHIGAIILHTLRKQRLVRPMLTGDKQLVAAALPSRDDAVSRLLALAVFAICAAATYALVNLPAPSF